MNHIENTLTKIQSHLTDDLLIEPFKSLPNKNKFSGHCYVASEAMYHLLPENIKNQYTPSVLKINNITHWFLKNQETGDIIDITKDQFNIQLDYTQSRNCGFLTKNPSKRTQILLSRINSEYRNAHFHTLTYEKTIFIFFTIKEIIKYNNTKLRNIKREYLQKYDKVFIYDELDIKNHKHIIKDKIRKEKKLKQRKIHARKCIINQCHPDIKNQFLNIYHIQGADKSPIAYSILFENELIGIICFSPLTDDKSFYELSRFAIKSNISVNGIFKKAINKFVSEYSPRIISSFADLNHSNESNIYIKNGFKLVKHLKPTYKLYSPEKHKKFHKYTYGNRFYKKHENEFTSVNDVHSKLDLHKIWNSGMLKYEMYFNENQDVLYGFIYKIQNKINNKIYIGQTSRTLTKRIYEYKSAFNKGDLHNSYLLNAFNKYGFDNFDFTLIDSSKNQNLLNEREVFWIGHYNTTNKELGYNISVGGDNAIPTIETRIKMSIAHSGSKQSEEWINKRVSKAGSEEAKKYGTFKSDEEKKYLSENSAKFWLGKTRSEETKAKVSATKKAQGLLPPNTKKVVKYDIKSNEILETYASTTEASRQNSEFTQSKISRICNGKANSKHYFSFKFV